MCDTPYCLTVKRLRKLLEPFADDVEVLIHQGEAKYPLRTINIKFVPECSIGNPEVRIVTGEEMVY